MPFDIPISPFPYIKVTDKDQLIIATSNTNTFIFISVNIIKLTTNETKYIYK